jgi:pyruvate/2-oxoglutarate dehydrogenase complex dihydrolipoamide dehydrogenase (E3) component
MTEDAAPFDVLIVGAGPGGIAAAVIAAEARRRVCLIDEAPFAGGQIWRNLGDAPKSSSGRRWMSRLSAVAGSINWLRQSRVIASPAANTLLAETPTGPRDLQWKSLILATGARELFLPFPGWTLPGVVGAGGVQALVKQGLPIAGKRVILAGTGPLLLAVATLLRSEGADVPIILEQASTARINQFAKSLLKSPSKLLAAIAMRAKLLGTRYSPDSYPLRVSKTTSGLRLAFRSGRTDQSIDCDYLACGFNLIPNNELAGLLGCEFTAEGFVQVDAQIRTTVANVYAIGELTGIGGVEKALVVGQIAANVAIGNGQSADALARHHAAAVDFAHRLKIAFELRPELKSVADPNTMICRCEDVKLSALTQVISGRDAKLQNRCGMGPCQGRVCGPILQHLLGTEAPQIRPPVFPTPISNLVRRSE